MHNSTVVYLTGNHRFQIVSFYLVSSTSTENTLPPSWSYLSLHRPYPDKWKEILHCLTNQLLLRNSGVSLFPKNSHIHDMTFMVPHVTEFLILWNSLISFFTLDKGQHIYCYCLVKMTRWLEGQKKEEKLFVYFCSVFQFQRRPLV